MLSLNVPLLALLGFEPGLKILHCLEIWQQLTNNIDPCLSNHT